MPTYQEMERIQRRIEDGDTSMADADLVEKFISWVPSYNCESAAAGYFSFLSSIATYKPTLIEPLLKKAIEPVYYLGYENSEEILSWAASFAKARNAMYVPPELGKVWLCEELPNYKEFIAKCLIEYMTE
ncbi:hypothetical protein Elgi_52650 [Paenibacillus elgii]|uniref:hypothetical protein n=1 Tax=Paenibacillus elgii TaxID=189691 RepID=UPI002D7B4B80|nr:hypothetical protein Elgi_52650 [Paenibacillus elgii]